MRVPESENLSWARIHEEDFIIITERKLTKMSLRIVISEASIQVATSH